MKQVWHNQRMDEAVAAKIDGFFGRYNKRSYSKGQVLILSGDTTDYVYQLLSGKVKEYDVTYRGDEIILNVFKAPAFFPMSLAINKTPNKYIYEAESDIEIHQVPADEVVEFIKSNPDVMFDLLGRVYRGVDGLLGRMSFLMSGSAKSRLIYELIIESRRFGQLAKDGSYTIDINEKDLGARAGLSRETISREMHKLKDENLVEVLPKNIVIKNIKDLEKKIHL